MSKKVTSLALWAVLALCVLLPLQTHYVFSEETLQGTSWPWTDIKLYAVDIVIIAVVIITTFRSHKLFVRTRRFFQVMIVFWFMLLLANLLNQAPLHSWVSLLRIAEGIALAWVICATLLPMSKIIASFTGGMFVVGVFGLWQFAAQHIGGSSLFGIAEQKPWIAGVSIVASTFSRFLRSYGSFPHPNIFAGYLALAVIFILFLALQRSDFLQARQVVSAKDFFSRNGWTIIFSVLMTALIFTFSRNGWLAVGVGTLLLLIVSLQQNKKNYFRTWVQVGVVGCILLVAFGQLFLPLAFGRFTLEDPHEQVSIEDRQRATGDFVYIFKHNWLTGVGLNRFTGEILDKIDPNRDWWETQPVHNIYLLVAVEASVFSGLVFLLVFVGLIIQGLRVLQRHTGSFPSAGLAVTVVVMLFLLGMFDHYLITLAPGIFLLFFGFGVALRALDRDT